MLKSEFETLYGDTVSAELYHKIELVYTYHPFFSTMDPASDKKLIADFCKDYLVLIPDLVATALKVKDMEIDVEEAKANLNAYKKEHDDAVDRLIRFRDEYMEVR